MRPRYLLIVADVPSGVSPAPGIVEQTGLSLAFSNSRLTAYTNRACRCLPLGSGGVILGRLFHRHGSARAIERLTPAEERALIESAGHKLLQSYWGGYVAAIACSLSVRVLREPSASLPCYCTSGQGYTAFASDAELLVELGVADLSPDWVELARHFYRAGLPAPETALAGIHELLPGFSVDVPGRLGAQSSVWNPWCHVKAHGAELDTAAEHLSRTVRHCVRTWAAGHERLLVSVSGGLDSSIVAACLAGAGTEAVCLTMYGEDADGDERVFARALARHLDMQLIEQRYRLDDVEIEEPLGTHLPRPSDRTQALAYERAHLRAALEIAADAFVTGNGGDSVFGYSQSAAAVADRLLARGPGGGVLRTLADVCTQTGCSLFAAATSAVRILRRPRRYRWRPDSLFLHPDRLSTLAERRLDHPWLQAPPGALPGKAAHIASLLRVQQCLEPHRSRYLPVLNPLMSQPVMEACLGVPSWQWRTGGRDRALARHAFVDDLPPVILDRRVKGGPSGFAARILDHFRGRIRERLLEGHLAGHGVIDAIGLARALDREHSIGAEERVRMLELLAAEAWLDSWLSRSSQGSGHRGADVRALAARRSGF